MFDKKMLWLFRSLKIKSMLFGIVGDILRLYEKLRT